MENYEPKCCLEKNVFSYCPKKIRKKVAILQLFMRHLKPKGNVSSNFKFLREKSNEISSNILCKPERIL